MRIPLRRGGLIVAHALVSSADYERLAAQRWLLSSKGYAYCGQTINGRRHRRYMHRDILGLRYGDPLEADHWNGDRIDNRRGNLRAVTRGEQRQNLRSYRGSSSRFRGVSWNKARGKWRAYARIDGRLNYLGEFDTEEEAAGVSAAYRAERMPFSQDAA